MFATAYLEEKSLFLLGGDVRGSDVLHREIASWPGWRRVGPGDRGGVPCSVFCAPLWPANVLPMLESGLEIEWLVESERDRVLFVARQPREAKALLENKHPTILSLPGGRELRPYQSQAVDAVHAMCHTALIGDDMGLGKTTVAIASFHYSTCERALVICPAAVKFNWVNEIWDALPDSTVFMVDGTPKQRREVWKHVEYRLSMRGEEPSTLVINYDLLRYSEKQMPLLEAWLKGQYLICDESQYLKNRKSQRTRHVHHLSRVARGRLLLSGTPILDTPADIYSQIDILRPGTWTSHHNFANRHLVEVPTVFKGRKPFMQVRGLKNLDALNAVVNTIQIRRRKEEVESLPPKVRTFPQLELCKSTRRIYDAMRDYAILELSKLGEEIPIFKPQASSAVEAAMRCEQIAQGFVGGIPEPLMKKVSAILADHAECVPGRAKELVFPKHPKLVWLEDTINQILANGGRPLVLSKYNAPLFWLHSKWPDSGLIHGGVSARERQDIVDRFQEGHVPVLFCQVKCAVGWNGTRSQDVLFLSRDESPQRNAQAEDRTHRIGTKGTVNIQVPIVRDTIEVALNKRLLAKEANAESVLKNITVAQLKEML